MQVLLECCDIEMESFSNIYISLNWYDIPELVIPIMISLLEGCC
jgi:hypothetical protein